jgi:hypothetical protein
MIVTRFVNASTIDSLNSPVEAKESRRFISFLEASAIDKYLDLDP